MDSIETQSVVHLSVRALAESVHRRGGLGKPVYGGLSSQDGIRLHRLCFKALAEAFSPDQIKPEVTLNGIIKLDGFTLQISGRCDAIALLPQSVCLFEFKSFSGSPSKLPPEGEPLHWAQVKLYAHLYLMERSDLDQLDLSLIYVSDNSQTHVKHIMTCCRSLLSDFFIQTCRQYLLFATDILRSESLRRQSGIDLSFPFSQLREGQKSFMQAVIQSTRTGQPLMVAAPTGIGKTMAALYPAIKALSNNLTDQIFYLTHMTSARLVAAQALSELHAQGLLMKGIILYAKEQLCLEPDLFCDTNRCPYAVNYYDHLPKALQALFPLNLINRSDIIHHARTHHVCPFELALDMAVYCEVVICDYNYAFDPRARLIRFFNPEQKGHLLLVDEAHNLPERSRSMFSADCQEKNLLELFRLLKPIAPSLADDISSILFLINQTKESVQNDEAALDLLAHSVKGSDIMRADHFRAMRPRPDELIGRLNRFNTNCHLYLESHSDFEGRHLLLTHYFQILFFCRLAEEHYDSAYVTTLQTNQEQHVTITLLCLDASEKLAASYLDKHPAVFFSATLSPMSYYLKLIAGSSRQNEIETLQLPSPFPPENLLLLICTNLSTRYRQRQETVQSILSLILTAVQQKVGNYLVFVPSHAYLKLIKLVIRHHVSDDDIDILFQDQKMSEPMRQTFLRRFETFGEKTLVAFAVIGGLFAEGIDLSGDRLNGVAVIGVGLPQISPEREIMKQYFGQMMSNGYPFAYLFPGFNKVQQAAGRVIRSETDRGFVLLIDDRYDTDSYRSLFPLEWHPKNVTSSDDVSEHVRDFWGDEATTQSV